MEKDNQIDIFNIFHDGTITEISNMSSNIKLKIEIQYLAEMINEKFHYFYCELVHCEEFVLVKWSEEEEYTSDLNTIIKYELEILDAQPSKEGIYISCRSDEIIGGNLHIKSQHIKLYDESKNEISLEEIADICHRYWNKS